MRLSFQKVFLNLAGRITDLTTVPRLDLALQSDPISLQDLLKEIPVELAPVFAKLTAAGDLRVGLELKGTLDEGTPFPIKGTASISDGMVKYSALPKSINRIDLRCAFTGNSLNIDTLGLNFGENPVSLKADVENFKQPRVDLRLVSRLNLDDIKSMAELPAGSSLSGRLDVDLSAKGEVDPADPSRIAVNGKLDLEDVTVLWPPLVKPAKINGGFSLSSKAIGENLSVVIGRSSLKMSAAVNDYLAFLFADSTKKSPRPSIDFNMTSPMLDVDEFMPPPKEGESGTPKTEPAVTPEQGKGSEAPLIATIPGVDIRGKISAASILYHKIPARNCVVYVNIIDELANIEVTTGFAGGSIHEKIHADLRNTSNISFTNNLDVKNIEISDLMNNFGLFIQPTTLLNRELLNLQKSLFGKISLSSEFAGQGGTADAMMNSLKGSLSAKMAQGVISNSLVLNRLSGAMEKFVKIDSIRFNDLSTSLRIANSSVQINDIGLRSDAGDWNAEGSVGFDSRLQLQVSNRLTQSISSKILKLQSGGKSALKDLLRNSQFAKAAGDLIDNVGIPADLDGRVTLKLALSGPASNPQASFVGFGAGTLKSDPQQKSARKQATEKIRATVDEKKAEAEKRVAEERAKAEAQARQKLEEQKNNVQEKSNAIQKDLKKGARDKLKKLF